MSLKLKETNASTTHNTTELKHNTLLMCLERLYSFSIGANRLVSNCAATKEQSRGSGE